MAVDSSKFKHLSPSQLSELLDDDDKLGQMAQEMDEDNSRPYVAGECLQFLQDEGIEAMDWPARSPDLNPIEDIWDIMSRTIHQRHIAPQTVQELADALVQAYFFWPVEGSVKYCSAQALGLSDLSLRTAVLCSALNRANQYACAGGAAGNKEEDVIVRRWEAPDHDAHRTGPHRDRPWAQNVQLDKEMTLAGNRSLAEANLLYQPKLDSRKSTLTQKYQELQVLMESHQLKKTKLDQQSVNASLETLLALLQAEGAKIEEETENMAENFLDGGIQMDSFIDEYLSKRKLAHLRRVKIEKLQEMVLKGQRLPQVSMQPQSRPPEVIQAPPSSYPAPFNTPPTVLPRRAVPPPPAQAGMYPTPFAMAAQQPAPGLPYAASPCPPVPSRIGYQPPGQMPQPGYPVPYTPQYPPALPQRPPQRLPPNPGFIL
ncbi:unnamed protein product [Ranitomeya imitator]|uniref:VPS37 C-terminal domain-containing protein n=1 Tax=Ranitomeya imitator TaxID=111125 RepID=A0ABN9M4E6_9NEOB|nr:unnamed protein product [Ranitomeya imitator]